MRPAPAAAGFQPCRPGNVSRVAKSGTSAAAKRDRPSVIPLAVTHFTNSRRDGRMIPPLGQVGTNVLLVAGPTPADPTRAVNWRSVFYHFTRFGSRIKINVELFHPDV